jgi:hypothetical protein
MSGAEIAENVETRAGESAARGNLEIQVWREDALGASARLAKEGSVPPGRGSSLPPCGGGSGRGVVSGLSWTEGAAGALSCRSPADASTAGRRASGKSNPESSSSMDSLPIWGRAGRGSSIAACCTLRSGTRPTSGASIGTRCTTESIGTGVTVDVSVDSFVPVEASLASLPRWGRVGRRSSIADRCTPWSGTCLIGAPRPIRRD